jgi:F-type H+-transporting ATPase subunit c
MNKKLLFVLALMVIASPMIFAQASAADTNQVAQQHAQWTGISAAFAMAIGSSLCALAQGKAIAAAVEGMARNPGAAKAIQLAMLIGLAFIESLALYVLLMIVLNVK